MTEVGVALSLGAVEPVSGILNGVLTAMSVLLYPGGAKERRELGL